VTQRVEQEIRGQQKKFRTPVTSGAGLEWWIEQRKEGAGVASDQKMDAPALVATFKDKKSGESLGTFLLAYSFYPNFVRRMWDVPQQVEVGGKSYTLYFRPQRWYKPYSLQLLDFKHETYIGTDTPKDFSSEVKIFDAQGSELRQVRIWMNNPLRYAGETFYQSAWIPGDAGTVLQVVKNIGWMVPYVAFMIVATGMIAHMGSHLLDFARRRLAA
jgi:hypothetical protein